MSGPKGRARNQTSSEAQAGPARVHARLKKAKSVAKEIISHLDDPFQLWESHSLLLRGWAGFGTASLTAFHGE